MIRVMIVEDELAAMSYIVSLIRSKCIDVKIVGNAESGQEAIDILMHTQVDIVITDIQMAGINGIELAKWINRSRPGILTLIISGHNNFEYAKDAFQAGVVEYLLKPIRPSEFAATMEKLAVQTRLIRREMRETWLSRVFTGDAEPGSALDHWHCDSLLIGAIWRSVLPDKPYLPGEMFDYPQGLPENLAAIYIHDETRICFALPFDVENIKPEHLATILSGNAHYHTAVTKMVSSQEGYVDLPNMLNAAQKMAVPGLSYTMEYSGASLKEPEPSGEENASLKRLHYAVSSYQPDKVKEEMSSLFALWENENRRLSSIESVLLRIFYLLKDHTPQKHDSDSQRSIMDAVRDICNHAAGYKDMLNMTQAYCEKLFWSLERQSESGELAGQIEDYIRAHLGESLSIQQVCAVFGISPSYLSQLFRKYIKMSYVKYINTLRIEEAKRIMLEFPDMLIKDMATHLGFSDQFYFSKVFRSLTGISPSEYRKSV